MRETYSTKQVALLLGVCEETVRGWIKTGKLHHSHSISNQGAFIVDDHNLYGFLQRNPKYKKIEMTAEQRKEYLLAAKDKCMREISAAETGLKEEMYQLQLVLNELFKEES